MVNWQQRLKSPDTTVLLWVALCFGLTSAVYLSWLDRLVAMVGAAAADWVSMVAGYLFQAAGMGLLLGMELFAHIVSKRRAGKENTEKQSNP